MNTRPSTARPCTSCGQMCRSANRICMACRTGSTARYIDGEPIALEGGSWRPVRGVQRWVPDVEMTLDELEELRREMRAATAPIPIACKKCGALVTETCRSKNGHRTADHGVRHLPRICACGADLNPKCRVCETCARVATAERKARWHAQTKEKRAA